MRINITVSNEELAQLYKIARWQEQEIPGMSSKITAVAAACMRLGMWERFKRMESEGKEKRLNKGKD